MPLLLLLFKGSCQYRADARADAHLKTTGSAACTPANVYRSGSKPAGLLFRSQMRAARAANDKLKTWSIRPRTRSASLAEDRSAALAQTPKDCPKRLLTDECRCQNYQHYCLCVLPSHPAITDMAGKLDQVLREYLASCNDLSLWTFQSCRTVGRQRSGERLVSSGRFGKQPHTQD